MSNEQGYTNIGTDGIMPLSVETKEPTLVKEVREAAEKLTGVPVELVAPVVQKKKRGRPSKNKVVIALDPAKEGTDETVKEFRCATCREMIHERNLMKIGAGSNRWAIFCPYCQKSLGFLDQEMLDRVDALIKNNPTGR
jgi:hypothetical protein